MKYYFVIYHKLYKSDFNSISTNQDIDLVQKNTFILENQFFGQEIQTQLLNFTYKVREKIVI